MKRHKFFVGALLFLITAPIIIITIQTLLDLTTINNLWSVRRLTVVARTLLYGGTVGVLTTFMGCWMGYSLARSYKNSRIISLLILSTMGMPPFMYAFFAMDFSRAFLGLPFISGFWVSLLVSVIYWLPLSISLWMLYMIAIPKVFYYEPMLSINTQKAISKISFDMMVIPAKVIGLMVTLLAMNDYTIPSIFAYNTYPIEIMTIFSTSQGLAMPVLASLPMAFIAIVLMLIIVRVWQQMALNLSQNHHPFIRTGDQPRLISGLFVVLYFAIPVLLLLLSLVGQSDSFYLSRSFVSDLVFSYASAMIAAILVTLLAYYLVYLFTKYGALRKVILMTLIITFSIPGTLTGLMVNGYYEVMDQVFNIELYKTVIPVVHMLAIRFVAIAFMIIWFGFTQLDSDILDVASMNTKSTWKTLFLVLWPFMKFYIIGAALVIMMFSLGELSGTMMVISPGKSTLAVTIYNYLHYGSSDVVAMLVAIIFISIVLLIVLLGTLIYRKERMRSKDVKPIFYLIMLILLSGCKPSVEIPQSFEVINQFFDVMVMTTFNGQLYIGTNEGLFIMNDDHQIQAVELIRSLSLIHALYVAEDKRLYVGGMNGLIAIHASGNQTYYDASEEWLPDTRVLYVTGDESGHLYIGTFGGLGILELSDMKGSVITLEDGLLVSMVNRIVLTEDGSLWLASYNVRNGGITRLKDHQIITYEDELATIHITSTLQLENQLYFGGGVYDEGGLTIFTKEDNDWHIEAVLHEEDGFAGPKVRSLFMDGDRLYIGSEYCGLAVWEDDQQKIFTDKDGLSHNEVKCIYRYNGELLIGTRNGLSRLLE